MVQLQGFRCNGLMLPSVSDILASDEKYLTRRKANGLRKTKENIKRSNDGRCRGLSIHESINQYLLTGEADIHEEYLPFWDGIYKWLRMLDIKPYFAEKPVLDELSFMQQGDFSCLWSDKYKYAGIPDLIGNVSGVDAVVEFKTSNHLYTKNYTRDQFHKYHEWHSFSQAALQAAAYGQAFNEHTDYNINTAIIIVATPTDSQFITVEGDEFNSRLKKFKTMANKYNKGRN